MTRRRRDRLFLFASAAAGFGAVVLVPVATLLLVGLVATHFLHWQPDSESDDRLVRASLLVGLGLGMLVGPAIYFALSRPLQRRSPYHWWRLVRVYLLATLPIAFYILATYWPMPGYLSRLWSTTLVLWVLLVPPLCWLPDLYRREMPKVRAGFYRRARWVRRNRIPVWINAALSILLFGGLALLMVYVIGGILQSPFNVVRLSYSHTRLPLIVTMVLCLAIPYIAARLAFSLLTWRLADDGRPRCQHCGYDLTGNVSRTCPECGQAAGSAVTMTPPAEMSG